MTDRDKALLMQLEIERMGKEHRLPYVCIIGIPDENGATCASLGLTGRDEVGQANRDFFLGHMLNYVEKLAAGVGGKKEGG